MNNLFKQDIYNRVSQVKTIVDDNDLRIAGNSVKVGLNAGFTNQGFEAVAVGKLAGYQNQGDYAVAVGSLAAPSSQHARSIVINGTPQVLSSSVEGGLFIKPVRLVRHAHTLTYDPATGEIGYDPPKVGDLLHTDIFNQDTSGSGIEVYNIGQSKVWRTFSTTLEEEPIYTLLVVEVFAPYTLAGSDTDEVAVRVRDVTGTPQTIVETSQRWTGSLGGGTRSGVLFPLIGSYTPEYELANLNRTIEIFIRNGTDNTLSICKMFETNGDIVDKNNYTIRISQYRRDAI